MKIKSLVLVIFFAANSYAEEKPKRQIKIGLESTSGSVENHSFNLTSYSIHVEYPLRKEFGAGGGIVKEESWGYDGYYLDLYARYKRPAPIFPKLYLHGTLGIRYGIPSKKYDHFDGNTWVFLKQDSSPRSKHDIYVLNPSFSFSVGIPLIKNFSVEPGISLSVMEFGVKRHEPFLDEYRTKLISTYRIRFVYNR